MYEVKWDSNKGKMVRVKKEVENDKLIGLEESKEIARVVFKEYIENDYFIDIEFDEDELKRGIPLPRKERDISVDAYIRFMGDYLNRIRHGRKPDKSYFVSAPDGFGKKIFVYQAIKDSLRHGLRPTGLLDSHRLYQKLDKREYELFYDKFKDKDLAFITLGGAPSNTGLIVIKTALEYCERKGIPLMAISRFAPEAYHRVDVITSNYIGVMASRKGDLGVMELAGFNYSQMNMLRDEIRKRMRLEREDLSGLKKG